MKQTIKTKDLNNYKSKADYIRYKDFKSLKKL
jgi:hypothetical protein